LKISLNEIETLPIQASANNNKINARAMIRNLTEYDFPNSIKNKDTDLC